MNNRPSYLSLSVAVLSVAGMALTSGVLLWLMAGSACASTFAAIGFATKPKLRSLALNIAITLVSISIGAAGIEAFLLYNETRTTPPITATLSTPPPESSASPEEAAAPDSGETVLPDDIPFSAAAAAAKAERQGILTMPERWKNKPTSVDGANRAYYWHEALHTFDVENMRMTLPVPDKRDGFFRILVLGDSLTYGQGIDKQWTYTSVMARQLQNRYRVEIINMGTMGYSSEDLAARAEKYLPHIKADLVIYGVCLNDFLPSGVGQYNHLNAYAVPLPESLKTFFTARTRLARFISDSYDRILREVGLRVDFFDDILRDLKGYQRRFGNDVKTIAMLAQKYTGRPPVGLVLDQYPTYNGRGHNIARLAEQLMTQSRFDVIPTESYYAQYDGQFFPVSRWEGHPDEEAHAIWAGILIKYLAQQGWLQSHRK